VKEQVTQYIVSDLYVTITVGQSHMAIHNIPTMKHTVGLFRFLYFWAFKENCVSSNCISVIYVTHNAYRVSCQRHVDGVTLFHLNFYHCVTS